METFSLSTREIGERFTKSELYMIAWRSQEQHHHLMLKMKKWNKKGNVKEDYDSGDRSRYGANDIIPEGLPDHFYNKDGEVDLSQVTGREAFKYMSALGMPFPVIQTNRPNPSFVRKPDAS